MLVLILAIVATVLAAMDLLLWHTVPTFRTHVLLQIAVIVLGVAALFVPLNVAATV